MSKPYRFPLLARTDVQKSPAELAEEAYAQGLAAGRAEASTQAFEQGLAQGLAQAEAVATEREQQLKLQLQRQYQEQFNWLAQQVLKHQQLNDNQLQAQLYELICALTEQVLEFELSLNPQQLVQAVNSSLAAILPQERIESIQVAAADADRLQALNITQFGDISWQRDETLQSGTVQFSGPNQLHLLDFHQRLHDVLQQFRALLLAPLPPRNKELADAPGTD